VIVPQNIAARFTPPVLSIVTLNVHSVRLVLIKSMEKLVSFVLPVLQSVDPVQ
jgi:hypothetical protein